MIGKGKALRPRWFVLRGAFDNIKNNFLLDPTQDKKNATMPDGCQLDIAS